MASLFSLNDLNVPKVRWGAAPRRRAAPHAHYRGACGVRPHGLTTAAPCMFCPGIRAQFPCAPAGACACSRACRAPRRQVLVFYAPQMEDMAQRIAKACNTVQLCTVRWGDYRVACCIAAPARPHRA